MTKRTGILATVGCDNVPVTNELVLIDEKAVDANRATGVGFVRTHADFSAKAITESVCETRRGIPVHSCGIDFIEEALSGFRILGHYGVGMRGSVAMNMADRVVDVLHDMNGHDKIQKLLPEIGFHMQFHTRIL